MPASKKKSVRIAAEEADMISLMVIAGIYPSAAEVIREALKALEDRDGAFEAWVRKEIVPAYDEAVAHPERLISAEQVFENLRALHMKRMSG